MGTDTKEADAWEQSARIVEAFMEGVVDEEKSALLAEIAQAIRERAVND